MGEKETEEVFELLHDIHDAAYTWDKERFNSVWNDLITIVGKHVKGSGIDD